MRQPQAEGGDVGKSIGIGIIIALWVAADCPGNGGKLSCGRAAE
jgi:hypothetical protein